MNDLSTNPQITRIWYLLKIAGLPKDILRARLQDLYKTSEPSLLTKRQASDVIDALKLGDLP